MTDDLRKLFAWPTASQVPAQGAAPLHKSDPLLQRVEQLVGKRKAWAPIGGATRRTEPTDKLKDWLADQNRHADRVAKVRPSRKNVRLRLADFPPDERGMHTISTATRIVYLIDEATEFLAVYEEAFGGATPLQAVLDARGGVLLYVTNSVESGGRAFSGDPFTGQVTAYAKIFATDIYNLKTHNAVLYYPHQLDCQIFEDDGRIRENKGIKMLNRLADLLIFAGGVAVNPRDWSVLT